MNRFTVPLARAARTSEAHGAEIVARSIVQRNRGQGDTRMDGDAPMFSAADFQASDDATSAIATVAVIAFFGTVAFCALQAIISPRRTFCSTKME